MLILAGGQGTRLRPLTDVYPKPLLYLPGGRVIDYLFAQVRKTGIRDVGIVVHHGADQVLDHIQAHAPPDLHITSIFQKPPYTLLGALASASEWVCGSTLVLHGDNYFSFPLRHFVQLAAPEVATFLVDASDALVPEPDLAISGAYVLPPHVFRVAVEMAEADNLTDLVDELRRRAFPIFAVPAPGWRCNINRPADLLDVNRYLLTHWTNAEHPLEQAVLGYNPIVLSWVAPNARVEESSIGIHVTVGHGTMVRHSRLRNTLVFPGVEVDGVDGENLILVDTPDELITVYVPDAHVSATLS
ncbi:MAG: NDP-sugar synthase [Ardenticatenia bacterium]|nr:NDP-sugar synthase [Ardenticatenia bacterium]